jgi:hypothetical protein
MTVVFGPEDALYGTGRFGTASYGSVGPTKIVTGVDAAFTVGDVQVNLLLKPVGFTLLLNLGDVDTVAEANFSVTGYTLNLSLGDAVPEAKANVFPTGYSLSLDLGAPTTVAEANTTLTGLDLSFALGEPSVTSINRVIVTGVSAAFTLGALLAEGGTGAFFTAPHLPLQIDLGVVKPNLVTFVQGVTLNISINDDVTVTGKASFVPTGYNITFVLGDITSAGVILDFNQFANDFSSKRTIFLPRVA